MGPCPLTLWLLRRSATNSWTWGRCTRLRKRCLCCCVCANSSTPSCRITQVWNSVFTLHIAERLRLQLMLLLILQSTSFCQTPTSVLVSGTIYSNDHCYVCLTCATCLSALGLLPSREDVWCRWLPAHADLRGCSVWHASAGHRDSVHDGAAWPISASRRG